MAPHFLVEFFLPLPFAKESTRPAHGGPSSNSQFLLSIFKFLFVPQCAQGVHPRGPPCGNITGENRHHEEQERKAEQNTKVCLYDSKNQAGHRATETERNRQCDQQA